MGKKSAPKPPDPFRTAQAQTDANLQSAQNTLRLNALDRRGPFGSATFARDASGLPTGQNVSLTPGLQDTVNQATSAAERLSGFLPQDSFQLSSVPQGLPLAQNFFNQQAGLLAPQFSDQLRDFEVRAAERGLPVGSESFNAAFDPILRSQNLALQQVAGQAVQLTPQEEQRQIGNALLERQLPFQETGQALGLLEQTPVPSFAPQPNSGVAAPDIEGLVQNNFANQAQLARDRNSAISSLLGGTASLAFAPINPFGATTIAQRLLR